MRFLFLRQAVAGIFSRWGVGRLDIGDTSLSSMERKHRCQYRLNSTDAPLHHRLEGSVPRDHVETVATINLEEKFDQLVSDADGNAIVSRTAPFDEFDRTH